MQNIISAGLILAFAIVYPFMVGFGIEAFYQSPKSPYELCLHLDQNARQDAGQLKTVEVDPKTDPQYKKCFDDAQAIMDKYNRNLFLTATIFGFIAIATGTLIISEKIGPFGPGLVFGGLLTLLYANARTVGSIDKRWIFVELVIVFFGLIYTAMRFLQNSTKSKS